MTDVELVNLMASAPHNFTVSAPPRSECSDYGRGYVLAPPDDLELNGVHIRNVASEVVALVEQKRAIETQRDELLAALEKLIGSLDKSDMFNDELRAVEECERAIARVKGGAS